MAAVLRPFLITDLVPLPMLQDLADSLTVLTEVPLWFAAPDGWLLTRVADRHAVCARFTKKDDADRPCLRCRRHDLDDTGRSWPRDRDLGESLPCLAGLSDVLLPIRCAGRVIALLGSSQFVTDEAAFERSLAALRAGGATDDQLATLRRSVRMIDPRRVQALEKAAQTIARVVVELAAEALHARRDAAEAERQAGTDPLTGIANRREAARALDTALSLAERHGRPFGVMLLDIDHFKCVNDAWGHPTGDRVLVAFTHVLERAVRPSDRPFRIGGEEFLLVCHETRLPALHVLAERIRRTIAATPLPDLEGGRITASIGIVGWEGGPLPSSDDVFAAADAALYAAKRAGRDRVTAGACIAEPDAPRAHAVAH